MEVWKTLFASGRPVDAAHSGGLGPGVNHRPPTGCATPCPHSPRPRSGWARPPASLWTSVEMWTTFWGSGLSPSVATEFGGAIVDGVVDERGDCPRLSTAHRPALVVHAIHSPTTSSAFYSFIQSNTEGCGRDPSEAGEEPWTTDRPWYISRRPVGDRLSVGALCRVLRVPSGPLSTWP